MDASPGLLPALVGLEDLRFRRVLGVELLQVVRRPEQPQRRRLRLRGDEVRIGFLPGVADRQLVDDFHLGRLAVDQQHDRRAVLGHFLHVGDVFPVIAEILGRERMAVRPLVAGAQLEGEFATVLVLVALEDVGLQLEVPVVDDQAGVAVERHQARVARVGDQHVDLAAAMAGPVAAGELLDDRRRRGNALSDRRQSSRLHLVGKRWCLDQVESRLAERNRGAEASRGHCRNEGTSTHGRCSLLGAASVAADPWRPSPVESFKSTTLDN